MSYPVTVHNCSLQREIPDSAGYPRTTTDTKKPANLGGMRAFRTSPDLSGNTRIIIWWAGGV